MIRRVVLIITVVIVSVTPGDLVLRLFNNSNLRPLVSTFLPYINPFDWITTGNNKSNIKKEMAVNYIRSYGVSDYNSQSDNNHNKSPLDTEFAKFDKSSPFIHGIYGSIKTLKACLNESVPTVLGEKIIKLIPNDIISINIGDEKVHYTADNKSNRGHAFIYRLFIEREELHMHSNSNANLNGNSSNNYYKYHMLFHAMVFEYSLDSEIKTIEKKIPKVLKRTTKGGWINGESSEEKIEYMKVEEEVSVPVSMTTKKLEKIISIAFDDESKKRASILAAQYGYYIGQRQQPMINNYNN